MIKQRHSSHVLWHYPQSRWHCSLAQPPVQHTMQVITTLLVMPQYSTQHLPWNRRPSTRARSARIQNWKSRH